MELAVHTQTGVDTGRKIEVPGTLLTAGDANKHVLYLEIKRYLAAQRQGTHKSKERNEIVGSTRKLKKQKGTGTARAGSIKSPIFRGGGTVFGPRPRSYDLGLNKKERRLARRLAFSEKLREDAIILVETVAFSEPKTKQYLAFLEAFHANGRRSLLVTAEDAPSALRLSSRNVPNATVVPAQKLNAYAILLHKRVLIEEGALARLEELWS